MDEKTLMRALRAEIIKTIRGSVVFKHADGFTSGIPDTSITLAGVGTLWVEGKFVRKGRKVQSLGLQQRIAVRLGRSCVYVIYHEDPRRTYVVNPERLDDYEDGNFWPGYDHAAVAREVLSRLGGVVA
jgi:hypothetical protein